MAGWPRFENLYVFSVRMPDWRSQGLFSLKGCKLVAEGNALGIGAQHDASPVRAKQSHRTTLNTYENLGHPTRQQRARRAEFKPFLRRSHGFTAGDR